MVRGACGRRARAEAGTGRLPGHADPAGAAPRHDSTVQERWQRASPTGSSGIARSCAPRGTPTCPRWRDSWTACALCCSARRPGRRQPSHRGRAVGIRDPARGPDRSLPTSPCRPGPVPGIAGSGGSTVAAARARDATSAWSILVTTPAGPGATWPPSSRRRRCSRSPIRLVEGFTGPPSSWRLSARSRRDVARPGHAVFSRSAMPSRSRRWSPCSAGCFHEAGVPRPVLQHSVRDPRRDVARPGGPGLARPTCARRVRRERPPRARRLRRRRPPAERPRARRVDGAAVHLRGCAGPAPSRWCARSAPLSASADVPNHAISG